MTGGASAYRVLGVDPGADSAEIEQAYRRLIKQHHPDREGGDGARAAEINRAYRDLRTVRDLRDPFELDVQDEAAPRSRAIWLLFALGITLAAAILFSQSARLPMEEQRPQAAAAKTVRPSSETMDRPLNLATIDKAALDALRINRTRDEPTLADRSRDCHQLLRSKPSLLQFDRCAAFDDAVVQLEDRDPLRDQGPFSELAVSGRLWSGASALSNDSVAIDTRLDRIRLRVELTLANAQADASAPANSHR